jgi:hypothetical protein
MKMKTVSERLAEPRGIKVALLGRVAIGKTTQVSTIPDLEGVLFVDHDDGDYQVRGLPFRSVTIENWREARDLIVRIGGPNSSFAPQQAFSETHFNAAGGWLPGLDTINTVFIDGLTSASRQCFRFCEQLPEAISEKSGRKDLRSIYGALAREMLAWLGHIQHTKPLTVVMTGVLEWVVDDFNRGEWALQAEGNKTWRELPAILDEVITYQIIDFNDGQPAERVFVCGANQWGFPAKDRSGKLDAIEPPDLGRLLLKLLNNTEKKEGEKAHE